MSSKLLITGANGFVGRHLIEAALSKGFQVVAATRLKSRIDRIKDLPCEFLRLDYTDVESLAKALTDHGPFHSVIHNAGVTEAIDLPTYRNGNVVVTNNLLLALKSQNLLEGNFLYISSLAARGPDYAGFDDPISDYGKSKYEAEQVVRAMGLPFVIVRPTAVYGSGDKAFLELVQIVNRGINLTIGEREQKLTFVHASDLAALVLEALPLTGKTFYGHDNLFYSQRELNKTIKMVLNRKRLLTIHIPTRLVKAVSSTVNWWFNRVLGKSWHYNPAKIRELIAVDWTIHDHPDQKLLKFAPQYSLESGFEEAIRFYKDKGWL